MNYHELLVKARNIQARNGLVKRRVRDSSGRTCMVGSIWQAISDRPDFDSYSIPSDVRHAANLLADILGEDAISVMNDRYDTTLSDVLGWFDKGIAATAPPPPEHELIIEEESVFA